MADRSELPPKITNAAEGPSKGTRRSKAAKTVPTTSKPVTSEHHSTNKASEGDDLDKRISIGIEKAMNAFMAKFNQDESHSHMSLHSVSHSSKSHKSEHSGSGGGDKPSKNDYAKEKNRSSEKKKGCTFKTFMSCNPTTFLGDKGATDAIRWLEEVETVLDISNCAEEDMIKFAAQLFKSEAMFWWKSVLQTRGRKTVYAMDWKEFNQLVLEKFCPENEIERIEAEFLKLSMVGTKHREYTSRYCELGRLVPHLITPESKRISRYIWGLSPEIRGTVKAARCTTFQSAVDLAGSMNDEQIRLKAERVDPESKKRPSDHSRPKQEDSKRKKPENGNDRTTCRTCGKEHLGKCRYEKAACGICKKPGHPTSSCHFISEATCHGCGEK